MEINFREIEPDMDNLVRLYMVFGEDTFTYEEANSVSDFSPNFIKSMREHGWVSRVNEEDSQNEWKITYNGARMTEIYMELQSERRKTTKENQNQVTLF
jgi:predicted transcriptional regulator